MDIFQSLADVSRERVLEFLVIGGHAVNAYGYSRETADLDLLIRKAQRDSWLAWFQSLGYSIFHDGENFLQLVPPPEARWPVDLMLVNDESFAAMLAASRPIEQEPARPRIPSVDHLIALKLHALKHTRIHRFLKDFQDVIGLIESQKIDPDSEKLKQLFEKYGTIELYGKVRRALSEN
jgi:hypothetical protein